MDQSFVCSRSATPAPLSTRPGSRVTLLPAEALRPFAQARDEATAAKGMAGELVLLSRFDLVCLNFMRFVTT